MHFVRTIFSAFLLLSLSNTCCVAADGCTSDEECLNGGYCDNNDGIFNDPNHPDDILPSKCLCTPEFTGNFCEESSHNTCSIDADCQNGGSCLLETGTIHGICACAPDYYGYKCENNCPCQNGGTCKTLSATGTYGCICKEGFLDPLCSSEVGVKTEKELEEEEDNEILMLIVGISFGIFFLLLLVAHWSNGAIAENETGEEGGAKTGNPAVERTPDGQIIYRSGGEDHQPDNLSDISGMEDTEDGRMADLELT